LYGSLQSGHLLIKEAVKWRIRLVGIWGAKSRRFDVEYAPNCRDGFGTNGGGAPHIWRPMFGQ